MKFKDLEVGQKFSFATGKDIYKRIAGTNYTYTSNGAVRYVASRNVEVVPEDEPPSYYEAQKRDARWWILQNMEVTIPEAREESDHGASVPEAVRRLKREKLVNGLDVLKFELEDVDEKTQRVLHDLIEIVRELV